VQRARAVAPDDAAFSTLAPLVVAACAAAARVRVRAEREERAHEIELAEHATHVC
jgi:hypothetical protein